MSVSTIRKVELIVEATNDIFPDEIDKDITFKYTKMYNGEFEINQTKVKVVKCNISEVI